MFFLMNLLTQPAKDLLSWSARNSILIRKYKEVKQIKH